MEIEGLGFLTRNRIAVAAILFVLLGSYFALASGADLSTRENTAKTFVQAMVSGDDALMEQVNRSEPWDAPTNFVMSNMAPNYSGYSINDFDFNISGNIVEVESYDGEVSNRLVIEPVGDEYFFITFR